MLSLGPETKAEPTGHTAVIEEVSGHPKTGNYQVTIVSENAPTPKTIKVVNGHWSSIFGYYKYNWTVQSVGTSASPSLIITTPSTSSSPPNAAVGSPYSFQFTAGDAPGTYVWSLRKGALPRGYALSSSGLISGTPTAVSKLGPFIVKVADGGLVNYADFGLWALRGIKPTTTTTIVPSTYWGRCGTPEGPIGGCFIESSHTVQEFQVTEACLGATRRLRLLRGDHEGPTDLYQWRILLQRPRECLERSGQHRHQGVGDAHWKVHVIYESVSLPADHVRAVWHLSTDDHGDTDLNDVNHIRLRWWWSPEGTYSLPQLKRPTCH